MSGRDSGSALASKLEESKQEVVQLKTNLEKVTTESNRDFLTGIANRKALDAKLDELTHWAKESGEPAMLRGLGELMLGGFG